MLEVILAINFAFGYVDIHMIKRFGQTKNPRVTESIDLSSKPLLNLVPLVKVKCVHSACRAARG